MVVVARVGAPAIRVMQQAGAGSAARQRRLEGLDGQMPVVHRTQRPADEEAGVEVEDRREVPLAARPDDQLGGIPDPALVRPLSRELPVEQICRHRLGQVAPRGALEPLAAPGL